MVFYNPMFVFDHEEKAKGKKNPMLVHVPSQLASKSIIFRLSDSHILVVELDSKSKTLVLKFPMKVDFSPEIF